MLRRPARVIQQAAKTKFLSPGPRDHDAAMNDWRDAQLVALGQRVSGSHENLKRVLDKGIVVTTHYSGTGAAEMALAKIAPGRV